MQKHDFRSIHVSTIAVRQCNILRDDTWNACFAIYMYASVQLLALLGSFNSSESGVTTPTNKFFPVIEIIQFDYVVTLLR